MIGADISVWQGVWSPAQFAAYGFVIIRYGTGENPYQEPTPWLDPCFAGNWANAKGRTIRGAYWYADPRRDAPEVQADRFFGGVNAAGYGPEDLPLMLDYEQDMGPQFNYQGWALAFLTRLESHLGRPPILYLSTSRVSEWLGNNPVFARFPLMAASYGPNDGGDHGVQSLPWPFTIHQYTSVPHDLNFADDAAIHALVQGGDLQADERIWLKALFDAWETGSIARSGTAVKTLDDVVAHVDSDAKWVAAQHAVADVSGSPTQANIDQLVAVIKQLPDQVRQTLANALGHTP